LPARGSEDAGDVPTPGSPGALGRVRAIASRAFAETVPLETNGNGNENGHQAVTAGKDGESSRPAVAGDVERAAGR
jgi:hypothetical protein